MTIFERTKKKIKPSKLGQREVINMRALHLSVESRTNNNSVTTTKRSDNIQLIIAYSNPPRKNI